MDVKMIEAKASRARSASDLEEQDPSREVALATLRGGTTPSEDITLKGETQTIKGGNQFVK